MHGVDARRENMQTHRLRTPRPGGQRRSPAERTKKLQKCSVVPPLRTSVCLFDAYTSTPEYRIAGGVLAPDFFSNKKDSKFKHILI